jgi:glycosyltransferase involved in cell wall biosynthesis
MFNKTNNRYVLQLCHGYEMPFLDVARQYASLFEDTPYKVVTVYLTGKSNQEVVDGSSSDEVIFLDYTSKDIRGLKLKQINRLRALHKQYQFEFAIAHRFKAIYILQFINGLPVIGINHAYDVYKKRTRAWFTSLFSKNLYLLGVSNAIRDNIKHYLPHFPENHITTLYNRVNVDKITQSQYTRQEARKRLNLPDNVYVFANVGRLHPDKDQKSLIDGFAMAASTCPNSVLVIIGKGRLEQQLKEQAEKLGLSDRGYFMGVLPEAVNYFPAFDSFVLSSDF